MHLLVVAITLLAFGFAMGWAGYRHAGMEDRQEGRPEYHFGSGMTAAGVIAMIVGVASLLMWALASLAQAIWP